MRACITTVEYPPDPGGSGRAVARLVGFLADAGFDVHVFAKARAAQGPNPVPRTSTDGGTLHRITVTPGSSPMGELAQAIADEDRVRPFDIFHGFFFQMAYPCLMVAESRPVIASLRGIDAVWLQERLSTQDLSVMENAAWITSVSSDSLLALDAFVDIRSRSSFIPNSIDASRYPPWRRTPRNSGVVGTVCTFRPKKDLPLLAHAYARVPTALRRKLLLVGGYKGPHAEQVRHLLDAVVARHQLAPELEITGHVGHEEVAERLLDLRVFVVCSRHEGLPNAALEAAAAGVPIVATAVDGLKDVFTGSDEALLVPPGDVAALTGAVVRVLRDDALADSLSQGARRAAARFSPAAERHAWLEVYHRLVPR